MGIFFLRQQTWFLFANCSQHEVAIVFILSFPSFYRVSWEEQLKDAGRPSHNCTGADDNDDDDGDDNDDNDDDIILFRDEKDQLCPPRAEPGDA